MEYLKRPLSVDEQLSLLESRGLSVADKQAAKSFLSRVSYYRFSAYLLPFQLNDGTHSFLPGSSFERAVNLYLFDRELRHLVFNAIEKIEIALRARLINIYSLSHGGFWHIKPELFYDLNRHLESIEKLASDIEKSSETFIRHYIDKYESPQVPPAWMSLEVMSFGNVSKLYRNLIDCQEKKGIAFSFCVPPVIFVSWLQSLTYVRNICAHHARLWNRELIIRPVQPKKVKCPWLSIHPASSGRVYVVLAVIHYLLNTITDENGFNGDLVLLLNAFQDVPLNSMGFPDNWRDDGFWN